MKPATGLVLEGGGMRGVYTAGILEFFLEKALYFPYVIGVSAGACNAISYIAKQKGRNKRVNIEFIRDSRYLSYRNLWKEKSMFGMDFIFDELPNKLVPFDYETFQRTEHTFIVGATDCLTGKPVYFNNHQEDNMNVVLRASSSLPFAQMQNTHGWRHL
jgi:predicted patatin/cPLA2 family phospholipase